MKTVRIYATGLCAMSVCTSLKTDKAIEANVNKQSPTGIESRWVVSKDKYFKTGERNGCTCEHDARRRHVLLVC